MYSFDLTYEEALLLDGQCSVKSQALIEKIKREQSHPHELPLFGQIIEVSLKRGELKWRRKDIHSCPICDKNAGYRAYPRRGRYHRKGEPDYDHPKYFDGVAFNEGFIIFKGMGDICGECENKYNLIHGLIDYILENDLKIQIQKNTHKSTKYIKDDGRVCFSCKAEMFESEMGRNHTLMGNGTYPSKCPKCGAESLPFGRTHETKGFRMIMKAGK